MINRIFLFLILLVTSLNSFSQNGKKHNRDYYIFDEDYLYKSRPTIEISGGYSKLSLKNSEIVFNNSGSLEMKLGYTYLAKSKYAKNIVKYENNYLYGGMVAPSLLSSNNINYGNGRTWKFGLGSSSGYGYRLGAKSSVVLYNSGSIVWTKYDDGITTPGFLNNGFYNPINDFKGTFRFGTATEAGILIPLSGIFNIQAQYDRSVVFSRHMVWLNFGSMLIEAFGQTAIDGFVKAIMKSSPESGPIVNFLLKNALSYGIYELRKDKMNWPFRSASPMFFESFKAGFTFVF